MKWLDVVRVALLVLAFFLAVSGVVAMNADGVLDSSTALAVIVLLGFGFGVALYRATRRRRRWRLRASESDDRRQYRRHVAQLERSLEDFARDEANGRLGL